MGWNAQCKAARKAARSRKQPLNTPKYVATAHLDKKARQALQKGRDQAIAQAKAQYLEAVASINQQYGQRIHALQRKRRRDCLDTIRCFYRVLRDSRRRSISSSRACIRDSNA